MKNNRILIVVISIVLMMRGSNASLQNIFHIQFNEDFSAYLNADEIPENCKDSLDLLLKLKPLISSLQEKGFLAVNLDSIYLKDSVYHVVVDKNYRYTWLNLSNGNISTALLESLGYNTRLWQNKPVYYKEISRLMYSILNYYSNHGHPFAVVRLDSLEFDQNRISGVLQLEKNKVFYIDSINIISQVQISSKYLERYLEISNSTLFNRSKVENIRKKIKNLTFVKLDGLPTVNFKGNKAVVNVKLTGKKNSRFDVLIGLLPDKNKLRITGDIFAEMHNKFGMGEYAGFQYKSVQANVQELNLKLSYPYILNLPFGINSAFQLYRNTNKNRDISYNLGLQYQYKGNKQLNLFWEFASSRLLSIDSSAILASAGLPQSLDFSTNGLGIGFKLEELNYRFNPRKGYSFSLKAIAGLKQLLPNPEIQSLKNDMIDFGNSYDTLQNSYRFDFRTVLDIYLPFWKLFTLNLSNESAWKFSKQSILQNEMYRIGGSKLLRGFDEESLYVSFYTVFTAECRLLIGTNSYLFVFGDYGIIRQSINNQDSWDNPYGTGLGLSFDTGVGIMRISAALGSQLNAPLEYRNAKIHIGYVSLF